MTLQNCDNIKIITNFVDQSINVRDLIAEKVFFN